jgi:hypothetical protein
MAKPRRVLKKMLQLLDSEPMSFGLLQKKIKKHQNVVNKNLKIAKNENLLYQDGLKQYHLTSLGKVVIDNVERPDNFTRWQIETQETDPIGLSDRPKATCTLITDKAEKIREIDDKTASQKFNLEVPENNTLIKSALARVVDSILEILEKDMRLFTVRDGELAENSSLSISSYLDQFPGYDFLRRYKILANTDFKLLIEFNGKKWFKSQRFNELERWINGTRKSITNFHKEEILSPDRRRRINDAVVNLIQIREDSFKYAHLFVEEQDIREYLYNHFGLYGEKNENLEEIVNKAYGSGLFQADKKVLYYLKVNPEKYQSFIANLRDDESTTD